MLDKTLLKTVLATAVIPTILGLAACAEVVPTYQIQKLDEDAATSFYENQTQNKENIEHNQELLDSEGLEKIGQMDEDIVVRKKDGSPGYWVRDHETHNLYSVKPSDDGWTMTFTGLGQRDLDRRDAKDKDNVKKTNAYDADGGEGGEGGGEGGGGD